MMVQEYIKNMFLFVHPYLGDKAKTSHRAARSSKDSRDERRPLGITMSDPLSPFKGMGL